MAGVISLALDTALVPGPPTHRRVDWLAVDQTVLPHSPLQALQDRPWLMGAEVDFNAKVACLEDQGNTVFLKSSMSDQEIDLSQ
jgi:hypothetical protein